MSGGKFRTALTALSAISVPGVLHNWDVDAVPEKISRAALPALIVAPVLDEPKRRKYGEFQIASPSGSSALAQYLVTHLLLYTPIGAGKGARSALPGLVDLVDNYALAIRGNPKLGGALYLPTSYVVYVAPVNYGGVAYYAVRFWHTFTVET